MGSSLGEGKYYNKDEFDVRTFVSREKIIGILSKLEIIKFEKQERVDQMSNKIVGSIYSISAIKR